MIFSKKKHSGWKLRFEKHTLQFKIPSGTSRGILTEKYLWLLYLTNHESQFAGCGECSISPGLSPDFTSIEEYEEKLIQLVQNIDFYLNNWNELITFPSILFGLESAYIHFQNQGKYYFNNSFALGNKSIPINGLIWMGDIAFMKQQIKVKIKEGFRCLKFKVGGNDFQSEFDLFKEIRSIFPPDKLEIRLDANGAWFPKEGLKNLKKLSILDIHSIEQPIKAGQWEEMKTLCENSPIPIALDEELIGIHTIEKKEQLLRKISPAYIILKPSLHGGISGCKEWIELANKKSIPWWMTSALESNVGLQCIAQFSAEFSNELPQGLGTGSLYTTNFESTLVVKNGLIFNDL